MQNLKRISEQIQNTSKLQIHKEYSQQQQNEINNSIIGSSRKQQQNNQPLHHNQSMHLEQSVDIRVEQDCLGVTGCKLQHTNNNNINEEQFRGTRSRINIVFAQSKDISVWQHKLTDQVKKQDSAEGKENCDQMRQEEGQIMGQDRLMKQGDAAKIMQPNHQQVNENLSQTEQHYGQLVKDDNMQKNMQEVSLVCIDIYSEHELGQKKQLELITSKQRNTFSNHRRSQNAQEISHSLQQEQVYLIQQTNNSLGGQVVNGCQLNTIHHTKSQQASLDSNIRNENKVQNKYQNVSKSLLTIIQNNQEQLKSDIINRHCQYNDQVDQIINVKIKKIMYQLIESQWTLRHELRYKLA